MEWESFAAVASFIGKTISGAAVSNAVTKAMDGVTPLTGENARTVARLQKDLMSRLSALSSVMDEKIEDGIDETNTSWSATVDIIRQTLNEVVKECEYLTEKVSSPVVPTKIIEKLEDLIENVRTPLILCFD